jgi:nitrogenase iron protein NifH
MATTEHLLIVGKRGVGKSTAAANLGAALAEAGQRVVLIGYDSGGNSTALLRGNRELLPVGGTQVNTAGPSYARGFRESLCIEAGEADDGGETGIAALLDSSLVSCYHPDFVIHDVAREPDGSFWVPPAIDGVTRVFAVTSSDMAAVHVVNNLFSWLNTVQSGDCRFGGVVVNNLSGAFYESIVGDYVSQTGTAIVASIPHSLMVSVSDFYSQTLVEAAPFSHNAYAYRRLAHLVIHGTVVPRPAFLSDAALKQWAQKWGDIIREMETGIVRDGAYI